jgi:o-succinylbenzoate---CoA ligase
MAEINFLIHPSFKLHGVSYNKRSLIEHCSKSLFKDNEVFVFILDWLSDDLNIKIKSSGSTGQKKVFLAQKNAMIQSAINTGKFFKLKEGDRTLLCLPISFIAGKMVVARALVLGLDLFVQKPDDSPIKDSSKSFEFVAMTPYQLEKSIPYINKINCLIVGGSPTRPALQKQLFNNSSGVFETYGMSETLSHVAIKSLSKGENGFTAIPGVSFKSRQGYLEINAPYLSNLPIITKDKIELVSKTKFIWIGRGDFIINSGGIKILPEEVERTLSFYYLESFAICGVPDKVLGEKSVLVFEGKIPSDAVNAFQNLKKFERPKNIYCLKKFERINGKINRLQLKKNLLKLINERN